MPDGQEVDVVCVALHEAGHYIIAKEVGFAPDGLSITLGGDSLYEGFFHNGFSESTVDRTINTIDEVIGYISDRVKVLYAGVLGESLIKNVSNDGQAAYNKVDEEYAKAQLMKGGKHDLIKITELVLLAKNIYFPYSINDDKIIEEQLHQIDNELWADSVKLVENVSPTIIKLAIALATKCSQTSYKAHLDKTEIDALPFMKERYFAI